MTDQSQSQNFLRQLRAAFGSDLWVEHRSLATAYAARLVAIGAALFAPWPLKVIIDHVITARSLPHMFRTVES